MIILLFLLILSMFVFDKYLKRICGYVFTFCKIEKYPLFDTFFYFIFEIPLCMLN